MLSQELIDEIGFLKVNPSGKISTLKFGNLGFEELKYELFKMNITITPAQNLEFMDLIKSRVKQKGISLKPNDGIDVEVSNQTDSTTRRLIPVSDRDSGKLFFYDPRKRTLEKLDSKIYIGKMGLGSDKELYSMAVTGVVEFYPLNSEATFVKEVDGDSINAFNLYRTPKWVGSTPVNTKNPPERIWTLLNNVFPDARTLEYVLGWIYHAVSDRNQVYLCLVGPRGVGKTMIADLVGQLVGTNYYQKADDSMLDDKFNSQLDNARLIFYDEINVNDPDKINKLKRFSNQTTAVQAKGVDTKTIRNYASGILANNHIDGLQIGPEERRFSIVEIGTKDLREVMTQQEITILAEYLGRDSSEEPHQDITDFGHWLVAQNKNGTKYNNSFAWKEDYFYTVTQGGMSQWKQFLIDYLLDNPTTEEILIKDIKLEYRKSLGELKALFPVTKTISNFLYEHRHRDRLRVGEVIKTKDHDYRVCPAIKLTDEFIKFAEEAIKKSEMNKPKEKTVDIKTIVPPTEIEVEDMNSPNPLYLL